MSHLILRRINGKWRMFNKHTKKVEGKPFEHKEEAAIETHKQDIKEDKQIDKGEKQEHKEHPEFSKKSAKKIAIDHIKEHPDMYKKGKGGSGEENTRHPKHEHKYDRKGMCVHCGKRASTKPEVEEEYGDRDTPEHEFMEEEFHRRGGGRGSGKILNPYDKDYLMGKPEKKMHPRDTKIATQMKRDAEAMEEYEDKKDFHDVITGKKNKAGAYTYHKKGRGSDVGNMTYPAIVSGGRMRKHDRYATSGKGEGKDMERPTKQAHGTFMKKRAARGIPPEKSQKEWEYFERKGRGSGKILNPYDKDYVLGRGGDRPPMKLHLKEGALHKMEGVPQGKKMPASKLEIHEGDTPLEKKRKQFAINAKGWHH